MTYFDRSNDIASATFRECDKLTRFRRFDPPFCDFAVSESRLSTHSCPSRTDRGLTAVDPERSFASMEIDTDPIRGIALFDSGTKLGGFWYG